MNKYLSIESYHHNIPYFFDVDILAVDYRTYIMICRLQNIKIVGYCLVELEPEYFEDKKFLMN